jgi:hypothetical protein
VLVHHSVIGQDVSLHGGGASSCGSSLPALGGSPPYGDFEDVIIEGNLMITDWQSFWLGFFRDAITHDVQSTTT